MFGVELERFDELVRIGLVPLRVKRLRIAQQFMNSHPLGQIAIFGEIADAAEDFDGIGHRIEREDADTAGLGFEQAKDVADQGCLPCAVFADESEDAVFSSRRRHTR